MSDPQTELARFERLVSIGDPEPSDDVPRPIREALDRVLTFASEKLGIEPPEVRYFRPRAIDRHIGLYERDRPDRIWVAGGRDGFEMALTICHEVCHAAGMSDEVEVRRKARALVEEFVERESIPRTRVAVEAPTRAPFMAGQPFLI